MDPTTPATPTIRQAATALGVLVVVGVVAAVGLGALVGPSSATTGFFEPPPPLPADDAVLGVLGIDGAPLVGLDGEPLQLPLGGPEPTPPDNPDDTVPYHGLPPTEDVEEVSILDAHARTLEAAAAHQGLGLVQTLDLFRLNRMVADDAATAAYRDLLVAIEARVAAGDDPGACGRRARAATSVSGGPGGTVSGYGIGPLHRSVEQLGAELGC